MTGRNRMRMALPFAFSLLLVGALLPASALAQDEAYEPPHDKPGPAAERLLYNSFFVDRAPLDIEAGNMDLYLFGLKTEAAQDLRGTEGIELIDAPATQVSLILNPAPAREGELNPFSIKGIRQAMQYLVNREAIAQDIYRGAGHPHAHPRGPQRPRLPDHLRHRPRLRHPLRPRAGARPHQRRDGSRRCRAGRRDLELRGPARPDQAHRPRRGRAPRHR